MTIVKTSLPGRGLLIGLTAIGTAVLTACGGGGGGDTTINPPAATTLAVSGVVADGPLHGATVCYDLNDNGACDAGEPSAVTDADGKYSFDVDTAVAGRHGVIASVPADAVDKDTGQPVGTAFTLKSPPTGSTSGEVFVSPLTTLVVDVAAAQGLTRAEAEDAVKSQLGLTASPLANFVAASDASAATLAKTVNTVITEVAKLADNAGVNAEARKALVASVTTGDLSTLAALVKSSNETSAVAIATQVASAVLTERNLTPTTVVEHAETAKAVATAPPPDTTVAATGPFVSVRRFSFTDGDNYFFQAFIGDNTPGSNGRFLAHEVRRNQAGGNAQPFNRNTAYWNKASGAWEVCAQQWNIVDTKPQTATTPQDSLYCGASRSTAAILEFDVAGRRMADVVRELRASALRDVPGADTDASGLPVKWGPDPALLGDAVFPAGAKFSKREQTSDVGDTERYSLTDKPRIVPESGTGTFRHAASFDEFRRMKGNFVEAGALVTNLNTVFVDDLPVTQADTNLGQFKRFRAAFDPAGNAVRFFACDVVLASGNSLNCLPMGDGTAAVSTQADSRVLRFTSGYPATLITNLKRQRLLVERSGTVFGGWRDFERKAFQQRPNTVAWNALRSALAIPEPVAPTTPVATGPFATLRSFSFTDPDNFSLRWFSGDSSQADPQGNYVVDDHRANRVAGVDQPFNRNAVYWTGAAWYECPNDGVGVLVSSNVAPFTSTFCGSYVDERYNNATVTLNGRLMSEVVQDIRWYPTKDFSFDYANWGPAPNTAALAGLSFPAGSTMEYRGTQRKATPFAISTNATAQVRVPPANTSEPFSSWPFAASLDEFTAKYAGDLQGGALNGATTFFVHSSTLPSAPSADVTAVIQVRVAFDAATGTARFYKANVSATTGFSTNYVKLLDTTYSVQTLGGVKVLSFAAMPAGFEAEFFFQRLFAERNGSVWYGFKDSVPATAGYTIRMNRIAAEALTTALGIN